MIEHNNREIANKHAEYITGKELRQYVAEKVKKYVGENPSVFDGAIGSGSGLIAFKEANLSYVGFEINSEYFKKAEERITNEQTINLCKV